MTLFFDNLLTSIIIVDKDENVLYTNPRAKQMILKYNNNVPIEHIGKPLKFFGMCSNFEGKCSICPVKTALQTRQVEHAEYVGPLSGQTKILTCIPLVYDGISAVVLLFGAKIT